MGQIQETADNIASLKAAGVPDASISGYGGRLNADETAGILSTYNATKATAKDVFSPTNVAQTLTAPVAPYDYSDPLKLRDRINTELGVTDVQKQYQDAVNNLRTFDTGTTTQQFGMEQELNPMGVIRGEQATASGQRSLSRQGFADTAQALADRYNALSTESTNKFNILNTERQNLQQLMVNNPGAGITYTDTIDQATKKMESFRISEEKRLEKVAEEKAKDEYKKALKSTALQLGLKTSGSTKDIEKRLKKEYANDRAYKSALQAAELRAKQIANASAGTNAQSNTALANASSALLSSRGTDGKVDPNVYIQQRDNYLRSVKGATPASFDAQFGTLLSSQEQSGLGVSTTATRADNKTGALTSAQKDDVATFQTASQLADSVINSYYNNGNNLPGVGALGYGSAAGSLYNVGVGTSEGETTRNLIGNIRGTIAKIRGGTSFTANEEALLNSYVPTINDSPDKIVTKLQGLKDYINKKTSNLYDVSGVNNPTQSAPSIQDQVQELKNAGYTDEQIRLITGQ